MATARSIGRYQVVKRIAVGGMSEIFLASQSGLLDIERAVVVKYIREELAADRSILEMFFDEARLAACLKHPNIVHLYDVGEHNGLPYIAMEHIFGRDLCQIAGRILERGIPMPIPVALRLLVDCCEALHYAHNIAEFDGKPLRVIHRDLSPQNILISFDGVTKIVDFGIAKAEVSLAKTQAGVLKGKYSYMSPEQIAGKPIDHRSDQFALAVVFYELITGTLLFPRDSILETMKAVQMCEIPPIRKLRREVPYRLARILKKALQRNPTHRYRSWEALEKATHRLLKGSRIEQTKQVASFLGDCFAPELAAREQALQRAGATERTIIQNTGFEYLDLPGGHSRSRHRAPLSTELHQRILEAERTRGSRAAVVDAGGPFHDGTTQVTRRWSLRIPRPSILAIGLAVVFIVGLLLFSFFRKPSSNPRTELQRVAAGAGSLRVMASQKTTVFVDQRLIGRGDQSPLPLSPGNHRVRLVNTETGEIKDRVIEIPANEETVVSESEF